MSTSFPVFSKLQWGHGLITVVKRGVMELAETGLPTSCFNGATV